MSVRMPYLDMKYEYRECEKIKYNLPTCRRLNI